VHPEHPSNLTVLDEVEAGPRREARHDERAECCERPLVVQRRVEIPARAGEVLEPSARLLARTEEQRPVERERHAVGQLLRERDVLCAEAPGHERNEVEEPEAAPTRHERHDDRRAGRQLVDGGDLVVVSRGGAQHRLRDVLQQHGLACVEELDHERVCVVLERELGRNRVERRLLRPVLRV
jgi:hypothetical protein